MEERLLNILMNTELLLTKWTKEEWLSWSKKHKGKNIFFGAGLMTQTNLSEAVPFDMLGMLFIAELLRRLIKGKVFILIADQHAITNNLFSEKQIQEKAQEMISIMTAIIHTFSLTKFSIIQTTTLNSNEDIKKIYRSLPTISNDYLKHEIADAIWLNRFHNVNIKLGWAMSLGQTIEGHDERFFDTEIKQFCPEISFIHTKPGRTANEKRQRVSPYISITGEDRLLLQKNENGVKKINLWRVEKQNAANKPLLRHLSQIIRLHDQLFDQKISFSLEEKAKKIIRKITKELK